MEALLPFHIVAGVIGLMSGAAALSAAKGATLHRGSGRVFVYAMVAMASSGAAMALWDGPDANAIGGLTAAYLVITALTTVRPVTPASRRLDLGATALGLAIGLTSLVLASVSLASGSGIDGIPAPVFVMFAAIGLLGGAGDVRVLRSGPLRGAKRLTRHLWRMCWALWIAVTSFFLGNSDVLPEAMRIPALLALPVVTVVVVLVYWLWRVRIRGNMRGIVGFNCPGDGSMTRATNARVAGAAFLLYIAVGVSQLILFGGTTAGDGARRAREHGAARDGGADRRRARLFTCFLALTLAVTLWALTREQDPDLAMLGLTCRVGEGVIGSVSMPLKLGLLSLATATGRGYAGSRDSKRDRDSRACRRIVQPDLRRHLFRGRQCALLLAPAPRPDDPRRSGVARRARLHRARRRTSAQARWSSRGPHHPAHVDPDGGVRDPARALADHQGRRHANKPVSPTNPGPPDWRSARKEVTNLLQEMKQ